MYMILHSERSAIDASLHWSHPAYNTTIPAGRHEVERIPNPLGSRGSFIVLKGTLIGGAEEMWLEWVRIPHIVQNYITKDMAVEINE